MKKTWKMIEGMKEKQWELNEKKSPKMLGLLVRWQEVDKKKKELQTIIAAAAIVPFSPVPFPLFPNVASHRQDFLDFRLLLDHSV